ncbi:MAG: sulfatase family protein, partial [Promethearchaeota archaeon]
SWNNHKGLEPGTITLANVLQDEGKYVLASKKKPGLKREKNIGIGKHDYMPGGHSQQNRVTAWTGAANIELPSYLQKPPIIVESRSKVFHKRDWSRCKMAKKFINQQVKRRNKNKNHKPFFLYLSLTTPHPRFRTNKYWFEKVDYDAVSIPPKDKKIHPVIRFQQISKAWRHGLDPESVKRTRAIYYAMIAETDAVIGEILNEVYENNLLEDTFVIITSDHGENNMEHDMFYKMNMYESSVRTPLIIAGPRVERNKDIEIPVQLVDLYPTILDMAGIPIEKAPNPIDGRSLMPLLEGKSSEFRDHAFSMYTGTAANTSMFMLRTGRWKYIVYPGYEPQLFNLKNDPYEINNIAKSEPETVKFLDEKLRRVCNYKLVHKEWQIYCKQAFIRWREKVKRKPVPLFEYGAKKPRAYYDDIMANSYKGWTKEHEKQLEKWLNSPD